jgi:competence protein ComEA
MKKILFSMIFLGSFLSALNLQTASKKELMCIKGIGEKKASSILKYRESHTLTSASDLLVIKGFGKSLVKNVKNEVKSLKCSGKKSIKKAVVKKTSTKKIKNSEKLEEKSPLKEISSEEINND